MTGHSSEADFDVAGKQIDFPDIVNIKGVKVITDSKKLAEAIKKINPYQGKINMEDLKNRYLSL